MTAAFRCKLCGHVFGNEKSCASHVKTPHRIEEADDGVLVGPLMETIQYDWDEGVAL